MKQKLALRRKRKDALIEKEYELKSRHLQEKKFEQAIASVDELDQRRKAGRDKLELLVKDMVINLSKEELPYAVQKVVEDKQGAELDEMLVRLFEEKARDLKDEVLALLEERFNKEHEIKKEFKDKRDMVDALQKHLGVCPSEAEVQKLQASRDDLESTQSKALQEIEWEYRDKQAQVERDVNERVMDREG